MKQKYLYHIVLCVYKKIIKGGKSSRLPSLPLVSPLEKKTFVSI